LGATGFVGPNIFEAYYPALWADGLSVSLAHVIAGVVNIETSIDGGTTLSRVALGPGNGALNNAFAVL
jgi:hypothetical protein